MALTITLDMPSSRSIAHRKVCRNHWNGRATRSATRSAFARLTVFGTNSPRTTCIALSRAKAQPKAIACAKNAVRVPAAPCQICCNAVASVASPSAPMARLVSVIPTWTPDTTRCKSASKRSTTRARMSPLATSWRTRESRTATRENSAAAKKPLSATSASTPISRTANIVSQLSPSGIVAVRARRGACVSSLHTRDGDKDFFSAQGQLDAAVLGRAHFQPLSKQFVAQEGFMRSDGFRDTRRGGIADDDAVGNIQVKSLALVLQHAVKIPRETFLQEVRRQSCVEREKSTLFQAALEIFRAFEVGNDLFRSKFKHLIGYLKGIRSALKNLGRIGVFQGFCDCLEIPPRARANLFGVRLEAHFHQPLLILNQNEMLQIGLLQN